MQKDFCTTKTVRKIHTESGRKGREVIRSGAVLLGGGSEEKGGYVGRDPPWGVSSLSHLLGAPALGSYTGKMSPLRWLAGTNRRAIRRLGFACEEHVRAVLLLRQDGEGRLKAAPVAAWFPVTALAHAQA